ncbi:hypothetical protein BC938DRAFT_472300 [Jimgerdemannia flammicorona]|uniref:BTB domain-containing protein n=1 Tax=Jimgerdemannia flammicorona TaxID=994334 RepID=A0A433Q6F0_9FUNG|nr:hypothetical protein BC938DRAFT_472300 [Jimgerdemannia flammicorona]
MATCATTNTLAHTWRIRNFGSIRHIFATGRLFSDTFWCPPLWPASTSAQGRASRVPLSWVIIMYPNGNKQKDHCSCYLRVVPTEEETTRLGWVRDNMNFTFQAQVIKMRTKFGSPETEDLIEWTSGVCSFDAENLDWGNHKFFEFSKLPPATIDHDLIITIHITFHTIDSSPFTRPFPTYKSIPVFPTPTQGLCPDFADAVPTAPAPLTFPAPDLSAQLDDSRFADITFQIRSDTRTVRAHRAILAVRAQGLLDKVSPSGSWATSNNPIIVQGTTYDIFRALVHYAYSSRFPPPDSSPSRLTDADWLVATHAAARVYAMSELAAGIVRHLVELAGDERHVRMCWSTLLRFGFVGRVNEVKERVLPWVVGHWEELEGSEGMRALTREQGIMEWLKEAFEDMEGGIRSGEMIGRSIEGGLDW